MTFLFTPIAALQPFSDDSSPSYPSDFFRNIEYVNSSIYTLGSNNIVDVYTQANPPVLLQSFKNYSFIYNPTYTFIFLSVNS